MVDLGVFRSTCGGIAQPGQTSDLATCHACKRSMKIGPNVCVAVALCLLNCLTSTPLWPSHVQRPRQEQMWKQPISIGGQMRRHG